jgi:hypothetical protein
MVTRNRQSISEFPSSRPHSRRTSQYNRSYRGGLIHLHGQSVSKYQLADLSCRNSAAVCHDVLSRWPAKHIWNFRPRLRSRAFGWRGSHLAQEELLPIAIEAPADRKPGTGGWTAANSVDTVLPRSDFEVSPPVCVKLRGEPGGTTDCGAATCGEMVRAAPEEKSREFLQFSICRWRR